MKRMKTSRTLILTISALMIMASCAEDSPVDNRDEGHTLTITFKTTVEDIPETKAIVRKANAGSEAEAAGFSYELVSSDTDSSIESRPMTKAPTTLKNAYALLFKSDGTFNGKANIGTMTTGTDKVITFTNVADPAATNCRLVVVANDNAAGNNYTSPSGTGNFANFSGNYTAFQALVMTNNVSSDADIPYAGSVTTDLSSGALNGAVSVPLYRTLAKVTVVNNNFTLSYNLGYGGSIPRAGIQIYNAGKKCFGTNNNYDGTGNNTNPSGVENTTSLNANSVTWYVGENVQSGYSATKLTERNRIVAPNAARVTITGSGSIQNAINATTSFDFDIYLGKEGNTNDFSLRRHTNYTVTVTIDRLAEYYTGGNSATKDSKTYSTDDPRVWWTYPAGITIDQALANTYKSWVGSDFSIYPPFNYDGGASSGTTGYDYGGISSSSTVITPYSIEVEKKERSYVSNYATAQSYCSDKGNGWRIPTEIELKGMWENRTALQNAGCAAFFTNWYWSSSVSSGDVNRRCLLSFSNGNYNNTITSSDHECVRCIREITPPAEVPPVVTINQAMADAYKAAQSNLTTYPPFNYDYGSVTGTLGSDYKGVSSTAKVDGSGYSIEVSKEQLSDKYQYDNGNAKAQCTALGTGWRLPTLIELFAMYKNKATLEAISGFASFVSSSYWSSSVCSGDASRHCMLGFLSGGFTGINANYSYYVRCVREI